MPCKKVKEKSLKSIALKPFLCYYSSTEVVLALLGLVA